MATTSWCAPLGLFRQASSCLFAIDRINFDTDGTHAEILCRHQRRARATKWIEDDGILSFSREFDAAFGKLHGEDCRMTALFHFTLNGLIGDEPYVAATPQIVMSLTSHLIFRVIVFHTSSQTVERAFAILGEMEKHLKVVVQEAVAENGAEVTVSMSINRDSLDPHDLILKDEVFSGYLGNSHRIPGFPARASDVEEERTVIPHYPLDFHEDLF